MEGVAVNMLYSTFTANTAGISGGALAVRKVTVSAVSSTFEANSAGSGLIAPSAMLGSGGAMWVYNCRACPPYPRANTTSAALTGLDTTLTNCSFPRNSAAGSGGAIMLIGGGEACDRACPSPSVSGGTGSAGRGATRHFQRARSLHHCRITMPSCRGGSICRCQTGPREWGMGRCIC